LYFALQKQHALGYWALQTLFFGVALFARIFSGLFFKVRLEHCGAGIEHRRNNIAASSDIFHLWTH
jgi:hypothetical protein